MGVSYKLISKSYKLLDILYFRNNLTNPRNILLNKIPNSNLQLLEVAVGTAKNSILIASNNPKVNIVGIDLSEDMLKIANTAIVKNGINNIQLIRMDAAKMAFKNELFDIIVISLLLHEIPENISDRILKECHRVLKNNGKVYVLEWEEPKKRTQKILFSLIKLSEPKEYKLFTKKKLDEYFLSNGFLVNKIEYANYSKVIELTKSNSEIC